MRTASFYVAYIVRKLWALLAVSLVVIAVALSLLRFSLPYLNEQKQVLEDYLGQQFGAELRIGSITAQWKGLGPAIVLQDIQLVQNKQSPIHLEIAETIIELDFWDSVLQGQIQSNKFALQDMRVTIDLASLQQEDSDYPIVSALEKLFLQQLQSFSISDSRILLLTPDDQQTVLIDQVSWVNKGDRHQGRGQLQIAEIAKNSASFILDLYGHDTDISGTFFAKGEELDLSPWVSQWLQTSHKLVESRGSFVMWASITQQSLSSVQLDISNSRFSWDTGASKIRAAVSGGQINAAPVNTSDNSSWVINLDNFSLMLNDQLSISTWLAKLDSKGHFTLNNAEPLELQPFVALLPLLIDESAVALLDELQPQAVLDKLQLAVNLSGELNLATKISQLAWQQTPAIPGLSHADAELLWSNSRGKLSLQSTNKSLLVSQILPQDIDFTDLSATLFITLGPDGLELRGEDIALHSPQLSVYPEFYYNSAQRFLAASANISTLDVADVAHFYPAKLMGEETKDYLSGSLQTGTVNAAQVLWHGSFSEFPFKQQQGIFQAAVEIEEGVLEFDPQWPALTDLHINLLFENEGLWMRSQQGKLLDVKLADLSAAIPSLAKGAILSIDAKGLASGTQVRELMLQSSLADSLGKVLQQVQIDDQLSTELHLHIPLSGKDVVASGKVTLTDSSVLISSLDLQLEHAKGLVSFVNDKVSFKNLSANLLNQAVKVSFNGLQKNQHYEADINIKGDWQTTKLLNKYHPALASYLSGSSLWQADVNLQLPQDGYEYTATVQSDLVRLQSELPFPFDKPASQARALLVEVKGNKQASVVKVQLGNDVEFNGNLLHDSMRFSRAHLSVGESDLVGMGLGFSVSANLRTLNIDDWYQAINHLISNTDSSNDKPGQQAILEAPKRVFISADNAILASQKLSNLELVVKNTNDSWLLDVNAKETRMEVALYKDWLNQGVNINADFIDLLNWQSLSKETTESEEPRFDLDPSRFPPIKFSCQRCRILNNDLGKVDLALSRTSGGMRIDNFRMNNSHGLLYAQGDWFVNQGKSSTRVTGEFSSSDFGALLKGFQFNSGIKDSSASAKFDLSWQQAPHEFNLASLTGDMEWRLSDGYLTEITDKGSRIFSILSLDSLVRKLKLDFRDVFAKGFFYDKMNGSFQIQNGIVDTRDTVVDGGAGEITMLGYADLNAQKLNYQISFAPKVTSSLPVIVAWMVNPATALAALAIDQVLTSAKVISNIQFSLTGTFDEPIIEELQRDSKEISLPAKLPTENIPQKLDGSIIDQPVDLELQPEGPISG
ncbi:YhdP family protein [Paraglaciecola hydrolytica]|uniref:YhdP central domain-containing protein n=1 Tax=Paraglaciecola hydrolytica TaxID=1799789 RepID=A0A136A4H1_9ALTE|nr:YhdP family protein [Paraglaciecola hydrolytica]KXI30121.1 hypothetical protein AX660_08980 [Paraglaciecola hydrolytica]